MLSVHIYRIFWVSTRQPTIVLPSTRQPTIVGATSCLWFMRCMLEGRCTYYKSMRPAFCNFMNCKERARRRRTNCATLSLTYPLLRCVVCSLRLHGLHTLYTVNLFLGGVVCSLRNMRLNPYEPQRGCATHMCTIHYYRVSYAFGDAPTCKTGATPYAQMIPFLWCVAAHVQRHELGNTLFVVTECLRPRYTYQVSSALYESRCKYKEHTTWTYGGVRHVSSARCRTQKRQAQACVHHIPHRRGLPALGNQLSIVRRGCCFASPAVPAPFIVQFSCSKTQRGNTQP